MKTYCPVHHFNYSGGTCPFCENDRIMFMVHKFDKPVIVNQNKYDATVMNRVFYRLNHLKRQTKPRKYK